MSRRKHNGALVAQVAVAEGGVERALRVLKKANEKLGLWKDEKRHRHHVKPGERRRLKQSQARRKARQRQAKREQQAEPEKRP